MCIHVGIPRRISTITGPGTRIAENFANDVDKG